MLNCSQSFKLDCCLTNTDAYVTGGSEDGFIYFWDLVDASVVSKFRAHTSVVKSLTAFCMLEKNLVKTVLRGHFRTLDEYVGNSKAP